MKERDEAILKLANETVAMAKDFHSLVDNINKDREETKRIIFGDLDTLKTTTNNILQAKLAGGK